METHALPSPHLVPYVVASTGHRDLRPQDLDTLRKEVRHILRRICKQLHGPQTTAASTPLVLLSGLAEGADQLIAEVALAESYLLGAILPMPLDVYRGTMEGAALAGLDALLARAAFQITLDHPPELLARIRESEDARADCYQALAGFLAHHGQALVALWDGLDSGKRGGTSSVVRCVQYGGLSAKAEKSHPQSAIVYQVVTPRQSGKGPAPEIKVCTLCANASEASFPEIQRNIRRFNEQSFRAQEAAGKLAAAGSQGCPLAPGVQDSPFTARVCALFQRADEVSIQASERRRWYLRGILVWFVVAAASYGAYVDMFSRHPALWLVFPFCIGAALVTRSLARRSGVEATYLDTRALAEALRVQYFWELAGIHQPVDDYYLVHHRSEMDWIRCALRNAWLLRRPVMNGQEPQSDAQAVLTNWVTGQADWYARKEKTQSAHVRRQEGLSRMYLWVSVGLSCIVPISLLVPPVWHWLAVWQQKAGPEQFWSEVTRFAFTLPAIAAAGYKLWIDRSGYAEQAREYEFMSHELQHRAEDLESCLRGDSKDENAGRTILAEVGREALRENARWLVMHRERQLDVEGQL